MEQQPEPAPMDESSRAVDAVARLPRPAARPLLPLAGVARQAGDMINELTLAMHAKISLGTLGGIIHPYPTQAEIIKRLGDAYNRTKLTPPVQKWMERWLSWTR